MFETRTGRVVAEAELQKLPEPQHGAAYDYELSRTGRYLAAWTPNMLHVVDLAGGTTVQRALPDTVMVHAMELSYDESRLAVALESADGRFSVIVVDLTSLHVVREFGSDAEVRSVAFSGDGQLLAWHARYRGVQVVDLRTGKTKFKLPAGLAYDMLAFSFDGKYIAAGRKYSYGRDGAFEVWRLGDGQWSRGIRNSHLGDAASLVFSPDNQLLTLDLDGSLHTRDVTARPPHTIPAKPEPCR